MFYSMDDLHEWCNDSPSIPLSWKKTGGSEPSESKYNLSYAASAEGLPTTRSSNLAEYLPLSSLVCLFLREDFTYECFCLEEPTKVVATAHTAPNQQAVSLHLCGEIPTILPLSCRCPCFDSKSLPSMGEGLGLVVERDGCRPFGLKLGFGISKAPGVTIISASKPIYTLQLPPFELMDYEGGRQIPQTSVRPGRADRFLAPKSEGALYGISNKCRNSWVPGITWTGTCSSTPEGRIKGRSLKKRFKPAALLSIFCRLSDIAAFHLKEDLTLSFRFAGDDDVELTAEKDWAFRAKLDSHSEALAKVVGGQEGLLGDWGLYRIARIFQQKQPY
ncbi:hypothetical protein L6452_24944 [Arctium lappa]|uniref:Uncharacterized protein n=1 Tax=Arctium lappa TaxID=4217 RepID=A0ACB9AC17_ARCLA|nr:hypothetical protein L6452_24944 [Arctium lappa]